MKLPLTLSTRNDVAVNKRSHAHLMETALNHHLSTKQQSHEMTITLQRHIGLAENDFKTRYRNYTASFRHAKHRKTSGLFKTVTLTTLFHGASFHLARPTTVQVKDVIYVSKINF